MPTASLIKVAVLIETYLQADEGKFKLTDKVTLHESDKVPGSGFLTGHFSEGASFSIRDAVRLMVALSDNTATNLVLDQVGIANVNKRMEAWGCPQHEDQRQGVSWQHLVGRSQAHSEVWPWFDDGPRNGEHFRGAANSADAAGPREAVHPHAPAKQRRQG